jgi:hypothetical protein
LKPRAYGVQDTIFDTLSVLLAQCALLITLKLFILKVKTNHLSGWL